MQDAQKIKRLSITLLGMLQGIGFRPFIYRLAQEKYLTGWVRNTRSGVEIECEGDAGALERFVCDIPAKAPPVARIDNLTVNHLPVRNSRVVSNTVERFRHSGYRSGDTRSRVV